MPVQIIQRLVRDNPLIMELHQALAESPWADICYLVGGAMRDICLGRIPEDYDLCVDDPAGAAPLAEYLAEKGVCSSAKKYKNRQLYTLNMWGYELELSQSLSTHSRLLEPVYADIRQDALGRDFGINALYLRLADLAVLDPTDKAIEDLQRRRIKPVLTARQCFEADPVRILRALRLQLRYELKLGEDLFCEIRDYVHLLQDMPLERISAEILQIVLANPIEGLDLLFRAGVYHSLSPRLDSAWQFLVPLLQKHPQILELTIFQHKKCICTSLFCLWGWGIFQQHIREEEVEYSFKAAEQINQILWESLQNLLQVPVKDQKRLLKLFIAYQYARETLAAGDKIIAELFFEYLDTDLALLQMLLALDRAALGEPFIWEIQSPELPVMPLDTVSMLSVISRDEQIRLELYIALLRLSCIIHRGQSKEQALLLLQSWAQNAEINENWQTLRKQMKSGEWLWQWKNWKNKGWI